MKETNFCNLEMHLQVGFALWRNSRSRLKGQFIKGEESPSPDAQGTRFSMVEFVSDFLFG